MKEKERLKLIGLIEEEKNKRKLLKEKCITLKKLEDCEIVKEYLKLKEELLEVRIMDDKEILKKVFNRQYHNIECNHDIYLELLLNNTTNQVYKKLVKEN